jgi:hypothetical protein
MTWTTPDQHPNPDFLKHHKNVNHTPLLKSNANTTSNMRRLNLISSKPTKFRLKEKGDTPHAHAVSIEV